MGHKKWFSAYSILNAANGATEPILPVYAVSLGASITQASAVYSAFSITAIFSTPFCGRLSDKLGKRKSFILIGTISTAFTIVQHLQYFF